MSGIGINPDLSIQYKTAHDAERPANSARASLPVEITPTHPLESLSALEIKAAYEIVTAQGNRCLAR